MNVEKEGRETPFYKRGSIRGIYFAQKLHYRESFVAKKWGLWVPGGSCLQWRSFRVFIILIKKEKRDRPGVFHLKERLSDGDHNHHFKFIMGADIEDPTSLRRVQKRDWEEIGRLHRDWTEKTVRWEKEIVKDWEKTEKKILLFLMFSMLSVMHFTTLSCDGSVLLKW